MIDYSGELKQIPNMSTAQIEQSQVDFMKKIYTWMIGGLGLTGLISYYAFSSGLYIQLAPYMLYIMLGTFGLVMLLSMGIQKMSAFTAGLAFIVFAAANGLFLSTIFAAYDLGAVYNAFFISAGAFVGLSFYGFTTNKDLSPIGKFMFMGLIGIILASVVNIWIASSALDFTISIIGVLVFSGLTAYDTQRLKNMHHYMLQSDELAKKGAIMGALSLYLDFLNLFLIILSLTGGSRD